MNIEQAQSVLGIQGSSFTHDVKLAYLNTLVGMLKGQIDVGTLNEAYRLLISCSSQGKSLELDDCQFNLKNTTLPSLLTLRSLVETRYNLTTNVLPLSAVDSLTQSVYFQFSSNAFVEQSFELKATPCSATLTDISNGGIPGSETVESISIKVLDWGRMAKDRRHLSTVIQKLYAPHYKTCEISKGWHWGKLFNFTFNNLKSSKVLDGKEIFYLCNSKFVRDIDPNVAVFHGHVDGVTLQIIHSTTKALKSFNPYTIEDQFKPLSKEPSQWSRKMVIRALANGQFSKLRGHLNGEEVEVHPIDILSEWVTQTRNTKACTESEGLVTFSTITDVVYSLKFDINNRYPALDLHQFQSVRNAA